jgi:hypothetical protein
VEFAADEPPARGDFLTWVNACRRRVGHKWPMLEHDRLHQCACAMIQWHGRSAAAEAYRLADTYYFEHDDDEVADLWIAIAETAQKLLRSLC